MSGAEPVVAALAAALGAALVAALVAALRAAFVVAAPDEWLLHVRGGVLLRAGVGLSCWRRPGDLVARFSSTLQRVGFEAQGLTRERLPVAVHGFIHWSVAAEGDAPFRAYRQLGLANLLAPPEGLKHARHLLTGPQHRAFQELVVAVVQRHVSTLDLQALLLDQDRVIAGLGDRLVAETRALGIRIDQVQVTKARPADEAVLANLAADEQEKIREAAARTRLETQDRVKRRELELLAAQAAAESANRRDRETSEARARLDVEREAGRLLTEKLRLEREGAEARHAEALLAQARKADVARREEGARHEAALAAEAHRLAEAEARRRRRALARSFVLDGLRAKAEAERDAGLARGAVEEAKSPAVREAELRRRVADAVGTSLKVTDGRWVTIGESPAASVAGLVTALGEALGPQPTTTDRAAG